MHFEERTIKVTIDESKCVGCKTHACVAGANSMPRHLGDEGWESCPWWGRGVCQAGGDEFSPASTNAGSGEIRQLRLKLRSPGWTKTKKNMAVVLSLNRACDS